MVKAVRFDRYGDIDELHVAELETPELQPGRVVVEVRAAGINPGEAAIRQGFLHEIAPSTFPSGQGTDFSGVVVALGDGAEGFVIGDEVLGWSEERSSQAQFVNVPADQLVPKPPAVSWEVAGSFFVVGVTAFAAVRAVGAGPDDVVVVSAAAGGVGSVVVQLLRHRGATVIGLASPTNHDWLRSVGARPVAYGENMKEQILAAAPDGVDAFIDLYGPEYLDLADELGVDHDRVNTIIAFERASELGVKAEGSSTASSAEVLSEMIGYVAQGHIAVPIAAAYPLDEVRSAFKTLEERHTHGKIVLLPQTGSDTVAP